MIALIPPYIIHPVSSTGGIFWGGVISDIGLLTLPVGMIMFLRHKNCHVKGCWHLGHPDPAHGHPVCRKHQEKLH